MSEFPTVPVRLRVHLAHATVQAIADEVRADLLHIKGPAVDASLRPESRASVDADVLIRPVHLKPFLAGLKNHGWRRVTTLSSGGLVEHSTNWYHGELGQVDVHVRFPGIQVTAGSAFDRLWRSRERREVAHQSCVVPELTAQRLILLLHAARNLRHSDHDVRNAWDDIRESERETVRGLARVLGAEVALAAATGCLDEFSDRAEHDLWQLYLAGTTATAGFGRMAAEIRAAPAGRSLPHLGVAWYVVQVLTRMPRRLASQSGSRATTREVLSAYGAFLRRGGDLLSRRSAPESRTTTPRPPASDGNASIPGGQGIGS